MDDTRTNRFVQGFLLLLAVLIAVGTAPAAVAAGETAAGSTETAKNVILLIGDGMGRSQVEAARWEKAGHDPAKYRATTLAMDGLDYIGSISTASASSSTTDSAAAATALMTGTRTNNGVIGLDPNGVRLETIAELAGAEGKAAGAVSTTRLTHATPAGAYAHVSSRSDETGIAAQFLGSGLDVALSGGYRYFVTTATPDPWGVRGYRTDGRNLVTEAKAKGYTVVSTASGLDAVPATPATKVLGLFAPSYMAYESARSGTQQPSLAAMTAKSLSVLSTDPDGFFLMVEGGQIDTAAHASDYANVAGETLAFDTAVATALSFADAHPGTLVIVTADHETGGLTSRTNADGTLSFSFSTTGHTAASVPIRASGPGAARFSATTVPNTEVFVVMRDAMGSGAVNPDPGTGVVPVPGGTGIPTDTNADGTLEDVNGNVRTDFADVVLYFNQMSWIAANEPATAFDCNGNGRIDFADVVWLFNNL